MTPEEGKRYLNLLRADKSDWITQHCSIPFQNIMINGKGDMYTCWCEAWLPTPIGNIMDLTSYDDFSKLFNNNIIRTSILDRSHRYCRANICSNLQDIHSNRFNKEFVSIEKLNSLKLTTLHINVDSSCNLFCQSCRNEVIINHQNSFINNLQQILDKIDKIFFNPCQIENVFVGGTGEFLASKSIFNWMQDKATSGIKFWLQTNGTLISQYQDKINQVLAATDYINVSIDASNKQLFEQVRRGGNWGKLMEGLELLNQMRQHTDFKIRYNYTISSLNYYDVAKFIEFCKQMKPNFVFYSKIERWQHLSDEQWNELNVFSKSHPKHNELVSILDSIKWPENSSRNFNYKI